MEEKASVPFKLVSGVESESFVLSGLGASDLWRGAARVNANRRAPRGLQLGMEDAVFTAGVSVSGAYGEHVLPTDHDDIARKPSLPTAYDSLPSAWGCSAQDEGMDDFDEGGEILRQSSRRPVIVK